MHPATLHGVGVNDSITLNLTKRSAEVVDFGTNRKRLYIFLLVVSSEMQEEMAGITDSQCDQKWRNLKKNGKSMYMGRRRPDVVRSESRNFCTKSQTFYKSATQ